jgi:ribosomal protein S18 acetylase RimI-like enzyme
MTELSIRQAMISDSAEIARIVNLAYRPESGAEGWTHESHLVSGERTNAEQVEELLHHSVILLGLHGSMIVACVQIESKGSEANIGMLAVEPAMQCAGIGKAMLAHAETYADVSLGAEQFVLIVVGDRHELLQFYRRRGYKETGQRLPYPVESGVGTPRRSELDLMVLRKRSNASHQQDAQEQGTG